MIVLIVLTLFGSLHTANAYYDPGIQRWINRDPLEDQGFIISQPYAQYAIILPIAELKEGANLFAFVHSEPIRSIDSYGTTVYYCACIINIIPPPCKSIPDIITAPFHASCRMNCLCINTSDATDIVKTSTVNNSPVACWIAQGISGGRPFGVFTPNPPGYSGNANP
jgi:hypothetical protein